MSALPISCIIPSRDRASMVGDAIASALAQSQPELEVIVVDDGSRDESGGVFEQFAGRIKLLRTGGDGVAAARNLALRHARGEYVAFLDSDDLWHPEKIATQWQFMRAHPELALTFTDYTLSERTADGRGWRVFKTRYYEGETTLGRLLERNFVGTLTVMARRDALTALGGFDTSLWLGSDYHLWLRVRRQHEIARIPEVLADYRWHAQSLTQGSVRRGRLAHRDVLLHVQRTEPELFRTAGVEPASLLRRSEERVAAT
jgi:glycosyltransferase involved in cell wall biosynthesis